MRKISASAALLLLLVCWFCSPAMAADGTKTPGQLLIVHRDGLLRNQTYKASWDHLALESEMGLLLRDTEEITVMVEDPNPLLFTYTWNGVEEKPTADYQNASQFAAALNQLAGILQPATTSGRIGSNTLLFDVQDLDVILARRSRELEGEEGETAKSETESPTKLEEDIKKLLDDLNLSSSLFDTFQKDVLKLSEALAAVNNLIARSAGDAAAVARVKSEVEAWDLGGIMTRMDNTFKKIDEAQLGILKLTAVDPLEDLDKVDPRLFAVMIAKDRQAEIKSSLEKLQAFSKDVARIDVPIKLGSFGYSATKVKTATFEIKAVEENAPVSLRTKRSLGKYALIAEPLSPVKFGFGGAMVYSFVEKPEFAAEEVDDMLRVVRKEQEEEYIGQKIAAVLTITPRAWATPIFGGHLEVGFNPEDDELAFFLGGAIRLYNFAHLGIGWTYQEVPELGGGLKVGDMLNEAGDLKLDTKFTSGVYISISVTTK